MKAEFVWILTWEAEDSGSSHYISIYSTEDSARQAAEGHFLTDHKGKRAADVRWSGTSLPVEGFGHYWVGMEKVQ